MRRRLPLIFLALVALGPALGGGQPAPRVLPNYSDAQNADLDRISIYLNRLKTLKAEFTQIDSNGDPTSGAFYLSRPGRLRFEYRPPSPTLVVATGGNIWVKNARLNTLDRYSLSDTPLELLLKDKVDLKRNRAIAGVEEQDGAIIVHARSSTNRVQGNITLVFDAGTLELRQWTVKDSQGLLTTVMLRNVQTGMALPDALFVAPQKDKIPPGKKGG